MNALPATVGRYEVKAFIARGGMGTIYLASDPVLQRQVAIKLLREADNEDLRARFTREARAAANLRHRNIVTIFDIGDHNGQPFIAMEYIHGQTLGALIGGEPAPSTARCLQFVEDLCDGLAYAHKRGVVHRDVKPANLMVDAEGTLKILDFGIARAAAESGMTQAGLLLGTLNYMSPEQVAGAPVDGRSDLFAVGAVMYELLTRRQAFPGGIDAGVLNRILNVEPEPLERLRPHLDPSIAQIVRRALQKKPDDRYTDLLQMRDDVQQARRALEESVLPERDAVDDAAAAQTVRATPTPRRGPDRDEIARRRAQQIDEHLTVARAALADGRWDESIARCEEALLLDPNEGRAIDIAEQARLRRDEASAREWVTQARQHLKNGDLTTASSCVREALSLTPESQDAIEMGRIVGEARLAQEHQRQRAAAVEEALTRGRQALARGEAESAMAAADAALAIAPDHEEASRIRKQGQQEIERRQREARDAAAQSTVDEARRLFAEGQHAEALAVLEQFWPAHTLVSHAWTELAAEAARLESLRADEAARTIAAAGVAREASEQTVFVPRAPSPEQTILNGPDEDVSATVWAVPPEPATVLAPSSPAVADAGRPRGPAEDAPSGARAPRNPAVAAAAPAAPPERRTPSAPVASTRDARPAASRIWLYAGLALTAAIVVALLLPFMPGDPEPGDLSSDTPVARGPDPVDTTSNTNPGGTAVTQNTGAPPVGNSSITQAPPTTVAPPTTLPPRSGGPGRAQGSGAIPEALREPPRQEAPRPAPTQQPPPVVQPQGTTPPPTTPLDARSGVVLTSPSASPVVAPTPSGPRNEASDVSAPAPAPAPAPSSAAVSPAPAPRETAAPAPPPAPPQPSDRDLIAATLNAYAAAYGRLDATAVSQLHPTIDRARLAENFGQMRTQSVRITIGEVAITGATATVSGTVYTRAEPRAGRAQETTVPTEFQLQKRNSGWVIVQRRTRQ